jgi:APA family basic amino acid/polyamine antiporter
MSDTKPSRARGLGFWMCLALVIGNMIGSGVFLLPASLAPYGLNSIFGWLMTAAGSVLLAIVFARLARVYPNAAGPYVYPRVAFGEAAGFLTAWGYWMAIWVGNAAIVTGTVAYLAEFVPAIKQTVGGPALASCALVWILTILNWRGVRQMGFVQIVTTVLKIMPLLAIVVLAVILLGKGDVSVIRVEEQPFTLSAITASATLTLWAFLGLESATVPAGSVIDPERTIPRATLWGTVVSTVIYIAACSTVVLLIPSSELAKSTAPFADVVRIFWGGSAATLLAAFAFISGFGALNGWILVHGEMPRALARDGIFPKIFARESKYGTPGTSLFITSGLLTVLVLMNYSSSMVEVFTFILLVSTSANLVMYLCCSVAAIKLAMKGDLGVHGRTLGALLVIGMLAAIYAVWTLYGAGAKAFWWSIALFALGVPVYIAMKWQRRRDAAAATLVAPELPG